MLIRLLDIADLQPTQTKVVLPIIADLNNSLDQHKEKAEVWMINGQAYIADGHHKIFDGYLKLFKKIPALYYSPKTCNLGPGAYQYLIERILRRGQRVKKAGILHVKDMQFKHFKKNREISYNRVAI